MYKEDSLKYILASGSPRRKELMSLIREDFTIEIPGVDEAVPENVNIRDMAEYLSGIKAGAVFDGHDNEAVVVIGSDTVVIYGDRVLGKPRSRQDAYDMLKTLSGKTHEVRTGATVIYRKESGEEGSFSFTDHANVEFYELTGQEIEEYISTGEPFDKAGAYGIQGRGALLVRKIDGDYYSVVGFPVGKLNRELKGCGLL